MPVAILARILRPLQKPARTRCVPSFLRDRMMRKLPLLFLTVLLNTACGGGGGPDQGSGGIVGSGGALGSGGQGSGGAMGSGGAPASGGGLGSGGAGSGGLGSGGLGSGGVGSGGLGSGGLASGGSGTGGDSSAAMEWLPSWATTIQKTETANKPTNALGGKTLRQFVWPTVSGSQIRIQLSNERGNVPVPVDKVHIALAKTAGDPGNSQGAIDTATDAAFTFGGMPNVTIPVGETVWSDPLDFPLQEIKLTAISMLLGAAVAQGDDITGHPGARMKSYVATGDVVATEAITGLETPERWYYIDAIEVMAPADAYAVAILGDSITDGYGVHDKFARWPDALTTAMKADATLATKVSVLDFGMGGNKLAGAPGGDQDPGIVRFERDVLARDKIKKLIVLEGTNDVDGGGAAAPVIAAYQSIVTQAEAAGIEVFISPITPMNAKNTGERDTLNEWVRASANYDAGIDLDLAIRDPATPTNTLGSYKNDDLHPNEAGYQAMGVSIDLPLLYP